MQVPIWSLHFFYNYVFCNRTDSAGQLHQWVAIFE